MTSQKLSVPRGNTLILQYTNQDTAGNPISLLGATIYFTAKAPPGYDDNTSDSSAVIALQSTGNTGNTCQFTITPAEAWQEPNTYDWDITIKYADGSVVTPVVGQLTVIGIATNRAS